jgi:hypothetical protein
VRVNPEEQRAVYALPPAVLTNGLTDGEHMPFVESVFEGGATMPRSAERNPLRGDRRIGSLSIIRSHQFRNIHQHRGRGSFTCQGTYFYSRIFCVTHSAPVMPASEDLVRRQQLWRALGLHLIFRLAERQRFDPQ